MHPRIDPFTPGDPVIIERLLLITLYSCVGLICAVVFLHNSAGIFPVEWANKLLPGAYAGIFICIFLVVMLGIWAATLAENAEDERELQRGMPVPAGDELLAANARAVQDLACYHDEQAHKPYTFELLIVPKGTDWIMCDEFLKEISPHVAASRYRLFPSNSPYGQFVIWQTPRTEDLGDLPNAIDRLKAHGAAHFIGGRDVIDAYWWLIMKLDDYSM